MEDGGKSLELDGTPARGGVVTEIAEDWKNGRFKFLIKRICQERKLKPITIVIALDPSGKKIDLRKSKLS